MDDDDEFEDAEEESLDPDMDDDYVDVDQDLKPTSEVKTRSIDNRTRSKVSSGMQSASQQSKNQKSRTSSQLDTVISGSKAQKSKTSSQFRESGMSGSRATGSREASKVSGDLKSGQNVSNSRVRSVNINKGSQRKTSRSSGTQTEMTTSVDQGTTTQATAEPTVQDVDGTAYGNATELQTKSGISGADQGASTSASRSIVATQQAPTRDSTALTALG